MSDDHIGLLPIIFKHECEADIYIPKGGRGIVQILLQDSVHIMSKEFDKTGKKPIYGQDEVDKVLSHIIEVDLHDRVKINDNVSFEYYSAEHIPLARQIYLELTDGINVHKIGFTGDISMNGIGKYTRPFESLPQVKILVAENTYNNSKRLHKKSDRKKDMEKLDTAIKYAKKNRGCVIIPTFANVRFQEILSVLYEMYDGKLPLKLLVDSPLSRNITREYVNVIENNEELWDKVYHWDSIRYIKDYEERLAWLDLDEPLIVLCSGGFGSHGTGVKWLQEKLLSGKNAIVFCGYASEDSPVGKIKNGDKSIKIDNKTVKNKANIFILNSFSSHADYEELMKYYVSIPYEKICLVHGEMNGKIKFSEDLKNRLSKANRTSRVICCQKDQKVHI